MDNSPNGSKDENRDSWTEEEGYNSDSDSTGSRNTGYKSESLGNQPQRIDRADGSEFNFTQSGWANTGGVLGHIIDYYREQVALKKAERDRLDNDILQLESRVSDLELLQNQLIDSIQENS
jgi:hypothetical protein